jgi:hypothetical protein
MSIDPDDVGPLLEEVSSFAKARIGGAVTRPEEPLPIAELENLTREALELGMLPTGGEAGFGLWESCDQPHDMEFNIGVLRHVARANVGVAFAWHRQALARCLERSLGAAPAGDDLFGTILAPTGHYGLARNSLARWLAGSEQGGDEFHLLADWLDRRTHVTSFVAPESWKFLLWPVWHEGDVLWQRVSRDNVWVRELRFQHGFDEVCAYQILNASGEGQTWQVGGGVSRQLYARILKLDMLGLLAIGSGGMARGLELAREYASIRKQGGKRIDRHPAVQRMLSDVEQACRNADLALHACAQPVDELDLGLVAASRANIHEMLCMAANQVVQVHGGIGYMRDAGAEKLLRDMNMLKLQTGGTREIGAFLAGWFGDYE